MSFIDFEVLKGKIIKSIVIDNSDEKVLFTTIDNEQYQMLHHQDCCESVFIEEIHGDLDDLLNSHILLAEKVSGTTQFDAYSQLEPAEQAVYEKLAGTLAEPSMSAELAQWTFYKLSTIKGSVTLRWYGSSNGYYSVEVAFQKLDK